LTYQQLNQPPHYFHYHHLIKSHYCFISQVEHFLLMFLKVTQFE
jgi:hypothetical protein